MGMVVGLAESADTDSDMEGMAVEVWVVWGTEVMEAGEFIHFNIHV